MNSVDRSDFVRTKTWNETGRFATSICLLFCALKCRLEEYVYAVILSDLIMFIKIVAGDSCLYLVK